MDRVRIARNQMMPPIKVSPLGHEPIGAARRQPAQSANRFRVEAHGARGRPRRAVAVWCSARVQTPELGGPWVDFARRFGNLRGANVLKCPRVLAGILAGTGWALARAAAMAEAKKGTERYNRKLALLYMSLYAK